MKRCLLDGPRALGKGIFLHNNQLPVSVLRTVIFVTMSPNRSGGLFSDFGINSAEVLVKVIVTASKLSGSAISMVREVTFTAMHSQ